MDLRIANHEEKARNQLLSAQLLQNEKQLLGKEAGLRQSISQLTSQLQMNDQTLREEIQGKQIAHAACDTLTKSLALSNKTAEELTVEIESLKAAACQRESDYQYVLETINSAGEQLTFERFQNEQARKQLELKDAEI